MIRKNFFHQSYIPSNRNIKSPQAWDRWRTWWKNRPQDSDYITRISFVGSLSSSCTGFLTITVLITYGCANHCFLLIDGRKRKRSEELPETCQKFYHLLWIYNYVRIDYVHELKWFNLCGYLLYVVVWVRANTLAFVCNCAIFPVNIGTP